MIEQYINIQDSDSGFTVTATVSNLTPAYGDTVNLSVTSPTTTLTGATWYVDGIQVATGTSTTWEADYFYGPMDVVCVATDGTGYGEDTVPIEIKVRPYVRPADWLDIDSLVSVGDQKIVGLFAVYDSVSNFVAFRVLGSYQVDWGDGTTDTYASGATATHSYSYSSLSPSTYSTRGYRQAIITITPQAGQNLTYWNVTGYRYTGITWGYIENWLDIKMSAPNLSTLALGGNLSYMYLLEKFNYVGTTSLTTYSALLAGAIHLRSVEMPKITGTYQNAFINCYELEYVEHDFSSATSLANTFQASGIRYFSSSVSAVTTLSAAFQICSSLLNVNITNIPTVTCANMFFACYGLRKAELTGTPSIATQMFFACTGLETPPDGLTCTAITTAGAMFSGCTALKRVLVGTFSVCTSMASMYYQCRNIIDVDLFDMGACQNASLMFALCLSLRKVPSLDTSSVTNVYGMFDSCTSLVEVGNLDTSAVTRWGQPNSGMFTSCYSLETLPTLDLSSTTTDTYGFYRTCQNMYSLRVLNISNSGAATGWQEFVRSCFSLQEIGPCDMSAGTNFSAAFTGCTNLRRMQGTGIKVTVSFNQCLLDATAINEIFTNLATVSGQTITVSQNPGSSTCNTAIATGKGWTVVT